jgi:2-polyprenyl-6-methoxyphenol hydroxylase-like FAD-dependent oxidoreductase
MTVAPDHTSTSRRLPVLIVGAGPTGLALAVQLVRFGVHVRIIDRSLDRVRESRALAVQARSIEILQTVGLAETLVRKGNRSARLMMHFDHEHAVEVNLAEFKRADTRFPFILFVSQAETEAVLEEHLLAQGVTIERGVELTELDSNTSRCRVRDRDGREEDISVRYVAGCDGSHSTIRKMTGIAFEGDAYLQRFVLGDVEIDGPLERDRLHAFPGDGAMAMFFPLGSPRTWRVIASSVDAGASGEPMQQATGAADESLTSELPLTELQAVVDIATQARVVLKDPA